MNINNQLMNKFLVSAFVFICMMMSCKESGKNGSNSNTLANLPIFPAETITELNKTVTSIDLISLKKEVNVSMSFDNPQAVQYVLSFADDEKGLVTGGCPPEGRIVFIVNGNNTYDAEIYYQNGCSAMVWLQGGKRVGSNKISNEGIDFFKNFLRPRTALPDSLKTQQQ
ncbi:MAG TPA: hypothetical protein PK006_05705 [Saprospiraceae bacterium]|nr:hypothetical protein [Saprospiraceae bacterium]